VVNRIAERDVFVPELLPPSEGGVFNYLCDLHASQEGRGTPTPAPAPIPTPATEPAAAPPPASKKRFDNPKKLGFMRFVQINYALIVIVNVLALTLVVKGREVFGFDDYMSLAYVLCGGVAFWLLLRRKRAAKFFIIVFSALSIIVGSIGDAVINGYMDLDLLTNNGRWFDLIMIVYFLTSRRAKAVLIQKFTALSASSYTQEGAQLYRPRSWAFWRNLIIYFCIFSIVGHWLEALYCTFIRFGLLPGTYDPNSQIWSDWLYPFVVYGFGVAACILVLFPVKNFVSRRLERLFAGRSTVATALLTMLVSFIANALVCTTIEFIMGMILNQPDATGHLPLWDYSNMAFNFMGQVCLQNALAFGAVATLMVWVIYPQLERLLALFSNDVMWVVFLLTAISFAILMALYLINIPPPEVS
jgi:uncharacterized membrane protein